MATDNNIQLFTAADIERYYKGLLSAKEKHAMEKAALDDPFLADAMEGYTVPGVNVEADIAELTKRLAKRTEETKVIPLVPKQTQSYTWLRAAAMIVVVLGAALLVYQFAFNKKQNDIAQNKPQEDKKEPGNNTTIAVTDSNVKKAYTPAETITPADKDVPKVADEKSAIKEKIVVNKTDDLASGKASAPVATIVEKPAGIPEKIVAEAEVDKTRIADAKKDEAKSKAIQSRKETEEAIINNEQDAKRVATANGIQKNQAQLRNNVFRGQVTDAHNNALPFANITNPIDNIGTYTDARGFFILTSPDTALNVQVRSLGYENSQAQLRNNVSTNQVRMQEDRSSLAEIVISNKNVNSSRARSNNMVLEEPEPADGWTNYDTYLANNIKTPDIFKEKLKPAGEVELSFEVNSKGEPVNITVTKSLCESCDKEAIRLIKNGPKWKRKAKKVKTTVSVAF